MKISKQWGDTYMHFEIENPINTAKRTTTWINSLPIRPNSLYDKFVNYFKSQEFKIFGIKYEYCDEDGNIRIKKIGI